MNFEYCVGQDRNLRTGEDEKRQLILLMDVSAPFRALRSINNNEGGGIGIWGEEGGSFKIPGQSDISMLRRCKTATQVLLIRFEVAFLSLASLQ